MHSTGQRQCRGSAEAVQRCASWGSCWDAASEAAAYAIKACQEAIPIYAQEHVSKSAQKLQSGLSESDVHGSMSAISKQPRKSEQRVQIVSNHLWPPGKPHQMSSQLIQPGNVLAAQPQHCSPGVGKDRDDQHAHSAAHTTGTRTALTHKSSCRPHQTFARVGYAATEIFRMDWDLDRSNDFDACLIVSINDLPSTPG